MTERTWEDNADEFALLDQGEGWPFAVLIACSVEKGAGDPSEHTARGSSTASGKVSATEFAQRAHTDRGRVVRFLTAWEHAADEGRVPGADGLTPVDAPAVPLPDADWATYYKTVQRDNTTHRLNSAVKGADAAAIVAALPPKQRSAVVTEIRRVQPEVVVEAAVEAVKSDPGTADALQRSAGPELFDAQDRVRKERIFDLEAQAVADGGKIPDLATINGAGGGDGGGYNAFIPMFNKVTEAQRLVDRAYDLLIEARAIMPFTDTIEKQIQRMALHLLEAQDKEKAE